MSLKSWFCRLHDYTDFGDEDIESDTSDPSHKYVWLSPFFWWETLGFGKVISTPNNFKIIITVNCLVDP